VCALQLKGESYLFYEIAEGPGMTDAKCASWLQQVQALAGSAWVVTRVSTYPTSPVICSKTLSTGMKVSVIDPSHSDAGQEACKALL
jgi:hypothetical protein